MTAFSASKRGMVIATLRYVSAVVELADEVELEDSDVAAVVEFELSEVSSGGKAMR